MSPASPQPRPPRADPQAVPFAVALAAFAAALVVAVAFLAGAGGGGRVSLVLLIVPALVGATLLALRRPVAAIVVLFVLIGFSGTLTVNTGLPVTSTAWLLMLGVISATLINHLVSVRSGPLRLWPGVAMMIGYTLFAAAYIPFAETVEIGGRAFIAGPAYVFVLLAVAYAPWNDETRWRMLRGLVVVTALVGAYALFRLIVGPTNAEEALATRSAEIAGELALFGSFSSRLELGNFCAIAAPILFAFTLGTSGRWRLLSGAAFGLIIVALLGSQVRTALIAAVAGICAVLVLFQLASAFSGARTGTVAVAVTGLLVIGGIGYAVTIADSPTKVQRFERILDPGSDFSFQRRVRKWNEAISEVNRHPFGQGLGTAGTTQRFHSRIFRLDNLYIDNSYLQIAVQLGYPGLILFVAGPLLVLWMLAKNAVLTRSRQAAVLGVGTSGALIAWFFSLMTGNSFESWGALLLSVGLGLAIGAFVSEPMSRAGGRPGREARPHRASIPAKPPEPAATGDQPGRTSTAA